MRTKDACLLGLLALALGAVLAPGLLAPSMMLGNFGDIYAYHLPLRHMAASRLQAGQMPFWNPCIFSGLPLLANPQAAVFYPPSVLFQIFPAGYSFTLHAAFHLALAALGMHLFLRRAGLDPGWSSLLTASFALSPMLVYRIPQGIPTQLAALSWVPWTWLALGCGRWTMLGCVWALQFLAGHPQYAAINAAGLALYALFDLRSRFPVFMKAAGLAAALSCAQLFLTAEFAARSNRVAWPPEFAAAYSLPPGSLSALVLPGLFGNPLDGSYAGPPSTFFEFQAATVGWIAAVLAGVGLVLRASFGPRTRTGAAPFGAIAWVLAGLGVFLALGGHNPLLPPPGRLPFFGLLRAPARFTLLLHWGILLAAADAAWRLGSRAPRWCKAAALALVFADLGPWAAKFVYAQDPGPYLARSEAFARQLAGRPVRFASDPGLANPNKAMLYRAMNVNGYEAFYLKSYADFILRAAGPAVLDPSRVLLRPSDEGALLELAAAWTLSPDGVLKPNPGAEPIARFAGRPALSESLSPERWRMSGTLPPSQRKLVFAVPSYPGWEAWLDGRRARLAQAEGVFLEADLGELAPLSPWALDFRFRPTLWTWLALANSAAAALWLLAARRLWA